MGDVERPDADRLRSAVLRAGGLWRSVEVVEQTGSTNADLVAAAWAGATEGTVLVTGYQSGGRGRLNRTWTAPPDTSLAVSMLLRPQPVAGRWTWLPLLTGLAVTEALRRSVGVAARLKWPNDVLIDDRKVCGILVERADPTACVIGVGINVDLAADQLPVPTATSLRLAGASGLDRTAITAAVLDAVEARYALWRDARDDSLLAAEYAEHCSTIGRDVRVVLAADRSVLGRAEAIDPDGRLVVATATGRQTFSAGDIVHLR